MKTAKQGFTLIEIMIVVAIIGLLAAIGVPSILKAYNTAQEKTMAANVKAVEDAKGRLTLPTDSVDGAMGLTDAEVDAGTITAAMMTNMWLGLKIDTADGWDALDVGNRQIVIGTFQTKATYADAGVAGTANP